MFNKALLPAVLLVVFGSLLMTTPPTANADAEEIDFSHDIQPIFARRCFKCHGPNESEAGLQLSNREAAIKELESGDKAIVPGKASASVLLDRIRTHDEDLRMPPEGKPLKDEEIAKIEQWINQGAKWSDHWAYAPVQKPNVPKTKDTKWIQNPIDAFVLKRLEEAGLKPADPLDKTGLIKRTYYGLIGLPPTPEEIDAFVKDDSPNAYEAIIDQLLDSPHYGEKWARHWLDLVRYAETNGYERDSNKELIWKYRDYVIKAFNEDKPYNRFAMEHISGDDLPDKDGDSITATGFYRLGIWDDEPADRELARYDYLDDIVRTTGETFLGMTIGCARCHDHKIDPIAQKDYYSMLSFFADVSPHGKGRTNHVAVTAATEKSAFEKKQAAKQKHESKLETKIADIETQFLAQLAKKHPELNVKPDAALLPDDGVVLADSIQAGQVWEYTEKKPADNWFEIAFDDSSWKKGPGGFGTAGTPGGVVRTPWRSRDIWLRRDFRLGTIPGKLTLKIHHDEDAEVYLNGKQIASFKGYVTKYQIKDVTDQAASVLQTGRNTLAIHCKQTGGGQYVDAGLIAEQAATPVRLYVNKYGKEILGDAKLNELKKARQDLAHSKSQKLQMETQFAMAVAERGRQKTWILGRGNPTMKGDEVGPSFPQILNPPPAEIPESYQTPQTSGKRRVLAEWIASDDNPMTARVIVNRVWQHHFGRGIVRSTSDFGFQGTPPTHPLLLDWLASQFVADGWSMKSLHKMILLSNTYRMSPKFNQTAYDKDPINNLFWRSNLRRLTAEEIRDSVLVMSGTLNPKLYGPYVFPPLPREVLETSSKPGSVWGRSSEEDSARRTIYVHVKRSLRPPMLANFDAPDTDTPCSARVATTVPTQALGMLNSKFMNEQAAKLAVRLNTEHPGDVKQQVMRAIRLTTGRKPTDDEVADDLKYISELQSVENLSADEALRHYCLLMLNTNEFVYLD